MLEWLKVDLHLHSQKSNEFKGNDWKGKNGEAYFKQLYDFTRDLNIFSVTDHNTIDFHLYDKLIVEEKFKNKVLPGVEIDISDKGISNKNFHVLLIFDIKEYKKLKNFIKKLHEGKQKNENTTWEFREIYESLFYANILSFFAIPHFNEKSKGLKTKDIIDLKSPLAIFSAFEDGNNPNKISVSIKKYLESSANNFPTVAFSDWHGDINAKESSTYFLGSDEYIYESLRLSFSDPRMRISFKDNSEIEHENIRSMNSPNKYLKNLTLNNITYELSPYQNTIIGGFGTGKSILSELILYGKDSLKESDKYRQIIKNEITFSMNLNDGTTINSLNDSRINCLSFEQNSKVFTTNNITKEISSKLESQLKIKFPTQNKLDAYNKEMKIGKYIETIIKNESPTINYGLITAGDFYNLKRNNIEIFEKTEDIISILEELFSTSDKFLDIFQSDNLENNNVLSSFEHQEYVKSKEIIMKTLALSIKRSKSINTSFSLVNNLLLRYSNKVSELSNGSTNQVQIIEDTISRLEKFSTDVTYLKIKCDEFDEKFSKDKIKKIINGEPSITVFDKFKLVAKYKNDGQFQTDIYDNTLKIAYKKDKSLFKNIISSIQNEKIHLLKKKKKIIDIDSIIESNYEKIQKELEENCIFDIICEDGTCLTNKSAGGRALVIMNLMLSSITEMNEEVCNVLVIDQPEDNMDNKHIYIDFVENIRSIKFSSKSIQLLFISHNANIAISADSENIIVANGTNKTDGFEFSYETGVLEDEVFREKVCSILEGGKEALLHRGIKYGINFNRKETNE